MEYDTEVRISLKRGMLNPEASTIERALALLGFNVKETDTIEIIKFIVEEEDKEVAEREVDDMCQRLLCNPVIHDYEIKVVPKEEG